MNTKQRTLILSCGALFFLCANNTAQAQQPPFETIAPQQQQLQPLGAAATAEKADAAPPAAKPAQNPYLDTYLALQEQIAVLNKMLQRERSVTEMVNSFKRMGISYDPPKPELSICQSIPENLSCALAYPEKYGDFLPPPAPLPVMPVQPVEISELPQPIADLSPDLGLKQLLWTDITCMGSVCRAVITPDAKNSGARYAIKVGDVLPQGGVVESISASGVFVSRENKIIALDPAPLTPFALTARSNSPS